MSMSERVFWSESEVWPIEEVLEPLIRDAFRRGYLPYRDGDFSLAFGIADGTNRQVDFSNRGRGRVEWERPLLEVHHVESNSCVRLGPFFGLEDSACIVVRGCDAAIEVCRVWLDGGSVESVLDATEFMNRRDWKVLQRGL